ncbi:MAG: hypothetical protein ACI8UO_004844 [Verrucomicrobiales bacterium]|jgi:hypothetical protein
MSRRRLQRLLRVDARGHVRTSREEREAIKRFLMSSIEAASAHRIRGAAFAKLHGIAYSTFAHWAQKRRRRLREREAVIEA